MFRLCLLPVTPGLRFQPEEYPGTAVGQVCSKSAAVCHRSDLRAPHRAPRAQPGGEMEERYTNARKCICRLEIPFTMNANLQPLWPFWIHSSDWLADQTG